MSHFNRWNNNNKRHRNFFFSKERRGKRRFGYMFTSFEILFLTIRGSRNRITLIYYILYKRNSITFYYIDSLSSYDERYFSSLKAIIPIGKACFIFYRINPFNFRIFFSALSPFLQQKSFFLLKNLISQILFIYVMRTEISFWRNIWGFTLIKSSKLHSYWLSWLLGKSLKTSVKHAGATIGKASRA